MPRDHRGWRVAPAPDGRGTPDNQKPTPPHRLRAFWVVAFVLLALNWISVLVFQPAGQPRVKVPFSPFFLTQLQAGKVKSISSTGDTIKGTFTVKLRYPVADTKAKPTTLFSTEVPTFWNHDSLTALLQSKGVQVNAQSTSKKTSVLAEVLLGFGPTLLLVGLFVVFVRRAQKGGGGLGGIGNFGRSQARRADPNKIQVTFDDVAGIDEAKNELTEIVDFLKNPERYQKLGGRMPHGVLLFGPPGTGKTLLARAVAGEAHAAFFSIAASEFIEAIVGVGAARVRDLFAKAKEAAPAIIFIDELDAIGRSRQGSAGVTGANDEREQTLDQILTEMDGFESSVAVIVLGATNRPEILDPALMRPGRFDRRVGVQAPDRDGRRKILEVHTRVDPAGRRRRPAGAGRDDAGDGRRRSGQPLQRGGAAGHAPGPRQGADERLHRLAGEDHARRAARDPARARRSRAHRLPRVRSRAGGDAHPGRRPGAEDLDHPPRDGPGGHALHSGRRSWCPTPARTWTPRSRSRSAGASPRRSSTARSPPAPNRTSSS